MNAIDKTCQLTILDQVNVRFNGLDPVVRRQMVNALKFEVPGARFMPTVKMGRWDGKASFCTIGGGTYINALDIVLPIIEDAGYSIDKFDDLRPEHNIKFPTVDKNLFEGKTWPEGHDSEGKPIELWDHQVECINAYLQNLHGVQEISTGAGKTLLAAALSYLIEKYTKGRTIIVVPNKDLVKQTEIDYVNIGLDVGVYYGDRKDIGNQHTICTWQSLNNLDKLGDIDGLNVIQAFLDQVNTVIVDECFDGNTLIKTSDGEKKIKDIKEGDIIINYDENQEIFKEDTVVKVHENLTSSASEDMYEIEFDNEIILNVTGNHKFLTRNRGWIRADCLTEEDDIIEFQKINSRSQRRINALNETLSRNKQKLRIIYLNTNKIMLSNGIILLGTAAKSKLINRIQNNEYIKFIDVFYGNNIEQAKVIEKELKSIGCSKGGKAVQKKNGNKIQKNLNTGIPWNKGIKTGQIPWNKGLTKNDNPRLMNNSRIFL